MNITVIGMGKIGLPLAIQFATKGHAVTGLDINPSTVEKINKGIEPFPNEHRLLELMKKSITEGLFEATTDAKFAISTANVIVVVVPLFVNEVAEPDFSALDAVTKQIAQFIRKGTLISYETTLPVGTTRGRFKKMIEQISNLEAGQDFHLVFSPERVLTGRVFEDLRKYPKIVGGVSDKCTQAGVDFYRSTLDFDERKDLGSPNGVWAMGSVEESEFVKIAETTYRDVNIGLANQFAVFADKHEIDVAKVIRAANSQSYSHIHSPGIAVGGHCIPIYPQFYLWNDPEATIVKAAREQNSKMPEYAIDLLQMKFQTLEKVKVLILGISYRSEVKETAFSGALALNQKLRERGASVEAFDKLYSPVEIADLGFIPLVSPLSDFDAVILQTDDSTHPDFLKGNLKSCKIVIDGRNMFDQQPDNLKGLVKGIGRTPA
jgi:nucleotide sugar dehydrogenase